MGKSVNATRNCRNSEEKDMNRKVRLCKKESCRECSDVKSFLDKKYPKVKD